MTRGKIVSRCSLCGHLFSRMFDPAMAEHLAEEHGLYFDPEPLHARLARLRG